MWDIQEGAETLKKVLYLMETSGKDYICVCILYKSEYYLNSVPKYYLKVSHTVFENFRLQAVFVIMPPNLVLTKVTNRVLCQPGEATYFI